MNHLEKLPLSNERRSQIEFELSQYRRFAHLSVEIAKIDGCNVYVRAEQTHLANGRMLTIDEIRQRIVDVFGQIDGYKLHVSASYFNRAEIDSIDAFWFSSQLEKYSLRLRNVSTHTGIDTSTLSTLRNGSKPMTKWHKIALYYYFKFYNMVSSQL